MNIKKKALGRGLSALLESAEVDLINQDNYEVYAVGAIANIPLEQIQANPYQPRTDFEEEALQELAGSIREQGIIQPITVRKLDHQKFQLIAGERRLRAAALAGLTEIPSYIRLADDIQVLEMALVENLQRKDLNPMETAIGYQRLVEECRLTQEQLSQRMGKNRSTITNFIRLLKLPAEVQVAIRDNAISMGHARALINVEDPDTQLAILKNIIQKDLSVRKVEEIVRNLNTNPPTRKQKSGHLPAKFHAMQKELSGYLNAKAEVHRTSGGRGSIVIRFSSDQELERISALIKH